MIKIFFSVFILFSTLYSDLIILNDIEEEYNFLEKIEIYQNPKDIDITTIMNDSTKWFINGEKSINLGFTNNWNWLKFNLKQMTKKEFFIEFKSPTIDILNVYIIKNSKLIYVYETGIDKPFYSRPLVSNKFMIPLNLTKDKDYTIYIKIKNFYKPNNFSFKISSHNKTHENIFSNIIFDGIIIGILTVMFFYNSLIYLFTKYKLYRFYLLYIFSLIFLNITNLGYGYMFLYPNNIILNKLLILFFEALTIFSIIIFTKDILLLKEKSFTNKLLIIYLYIDILLLITQIFMIINSSDYTIILIFIGTLYATIVITSIMIIIIKEILNKNDIAKYLLIAWIFTLVTLILYLTNRVFFFIDIQIISILVQLSFVMESILMSLIIIYKIKVINDQKKELLIKNQEKDLALLNQSKFASMGKLFQYISHQWKQPLMRINSILLNLELKFSNLQDDNISLSKYLDLIEVETQEMSKTISIFSQYFYSNKEETSINLFSLANEVIDFYKKTVYDTQIDYQLNCVNSNIETNGFKEEYREVLIILINNAIDTFEEYNVLKKEILITIGKKGNIPYLSIENNGSKIPEDIMKRIFEPYYTTKRKANNEGLGLYIVKMIIEDSMNKKINVFNTEKGVKFMILG